MIIPTTVGSLPCRSSPAAITSSSSQPRSFSSCLIAPGADVRIDPRSIRSAVLLLKQGKQEVPIVPDYVGFEIPDEFVVGYGLDYRDAYRNLPYLAALEPQDIEGSTP